MKVTNVYVEKIKEREGNPNKMTPAQLDGLTKSIQKYGDLQPVILDKDYVLIDGHQRKKAYEALGKKEIPAIILNITAPDKIILSQIMNKLKGKHDDGLDLLEYETLKELGELAELSEYLPEINVDKILTQLAGETVEVHAHDRAKQKTEKCPRCNGTGRINLNLMDGAQ